MRVFVVGAGGAIGRRLVPQLSERGHDVTGTARSHDKAELVRRLGAEPVVLTRSTRSQSARRLPPPGPTRPSIRRPR